ncbi:MAG TPA: hypothetical protein VD887_12600 [Allosphingosinicella sp.]|nr:hypothetical protein [Allosphingosinicella sp.]
MASRELECFIDETIRVAQTHAYHPTIFIDMRARYGTIPAISRLVESGDVQSGFRRLERLDLLEHTIEAAVAKFPWEFSAVTLECAEFRLRMVKQ